MFMTVTSIAHSIDTNVADVRAHNVLPEFVQFLESKNTALDETGIQTAVVSMPSQSINALRLFGKSQNSSNQSPINQVAKLPMQPDGIVRLSRVEVYPEYLDEYLKMAAEVGRTSLLTEPGVLTMYALAEKENPNIITILETYASQEAYKSHIASAHFQKYKQGTLHMVKDLKLLDQTEINPSNHVINFIK